MVRWPVFILIAMAVAMLACGSPVDDLWFDGDLDQAIEAASEKDTLVFIEFDAEWCSWCRRFESETLTDPDVRKELANLVAIQLDGEKEGAEAAQSLGIDIYPTVIFLDSSGEEVERIEGYLPPKKFLNEIRRVRKGDTLHACLEALAEDPANADAIRGVVEGLLERSDPEGAMAKIKKFHAQEGHDHPVCRKLMFLAGRDLHYRSYLRAAKLYRGGWKTTIEVPPLPGSKQLSELIDDGLPGFEPEVQASLMRKARFNDAGELLNMVDLESATGDDLYDAAAFAFRGGHYELAADFYRRWFADPEATLDADTLNRAAWQLYLAQEDLKTAIAMAGKAYDLDPSADISDTLARLRYLRGDTDTAIGLVLEAAEKSDGNQAEDYRKAAEMMKAGDELGDQPAFETYPGQREISL